jgi:hypothetical protein
MIKFNIPCIARPVDLAKYAPELAEEIAKAAAPIYMWVNLTRGARVQYGLILLEGRRILVALSVTRKPDKDIPKDGVQCTPLGTGTGEADEPQAKALDEELSQQAEALNQRMTAWWAEAWSQGPENARWTVEGVQAFLAECSEQDPALWDFIVNECWRMVNGHRESARKN